MESTAVLPEEHRLLRWRGWLRKMVCFFSWWPSLLPEGSRALPGPREASTVKLPLFWWWEGHEEPSSSTFLLLSLLNNEYPVRLHFGWSSQQMGVGEEPSFATGSLALTMGEAAW